MIKSIMFTTEKELSKLTGLNHEELWDNGFDLDDWDFGLCTDRPLGDRNWLRIRLNNYCYACRENVYNGKYYYMTYHS